jgi:succinate dehydrogenase flavin-adding protein (antitoxin of CptAB toxin-antitoxin module)
MRKLDAVEEAKALLAEAKDWGTWRWLTEKKRVRAAADAAWAGLEEIERDIKCAWGDDLRKAYRELQTPSKKTAAEADGVDPQLKAFAARLKQEDDEAFQLRMTAEETFDEAERRMSVHLARQGCEQAIEAYELRERFIRKAEAARKK